MNIIGITNGPIYETMQLATKPAQLWFVSTFFSEYTRRLAVAIYEHLSQDILVPYINSKEVANIASTGQEPALKDGVGKYHDRIIFRSNIPPDELETELHKIIDQTKSGMMDLFLDPYYRTNPFYRGHHYLDKNNGFDPWHIEMGHSFLEAYIYSDFIILDYNNVGPEWFITLSEELDALEMMRPYDLSNGKGNPFIDLFDGYGNSPNRYIKHSRLYRMVPHESRPINQHTSNLLNIKEIAAGKANDDSCKTEDTAGAQGYYAVVSADGDGTGKYMHHMSDAQVKEFSSCCMKYVRCAVKLVRNYGGMAIYAGGDDLLFLAPLSKADTTKSIFSLCSEINDCFREQLKGDASLRTMNGDIPTISFGISIQHAESRLYDALLESRRLLNEVIKASVKTRNSMAVHLWAPIGREDVCMRTYNDEVDALIRDFQMRAAWLFDSNKEC